MHRASFRSILAAGLVIVLASALAALDGDGGAAPAAQRSALHNAFVRATRDRQLTIMAVGNSVTHGSAFGGERMLGFPQRVAAWFTARFPEARIDLQTAIIFAIGPELHVFRLERMAEARPDVVLVEFTAANAAWGAAGTAITEPATEGYVRRLRFLLPEADCILNQGLFASMLDDHRQGVVPAAVAFQRRIADHYACAFADSQAELARRILAEDAWARYMGDAIHPTEAGFAVHGEVLAAELDRQYARFAAAPAGERQRTTPHAFPAATLHPAPWTFPRLVPAYAAERLDGFTLRERGRLKVLTGPPGAQGLHREARSGIVGILVACPREPAAIEVQADGTGPWVRLPLAREPRAVDASDRGNTLQRCFFAPLGLPLACSAIAFRVVDDPAAGEAGVVGFLVVDPPPAVPLVRGAGG